MWHTLYIFRGFFKNIVFKSVNLITKKVMGYFRFFSHRSDFLLYSFLPYALKKEKITKTPENFYLL